MTPDSGPSETKGQPGIIPAALSGLCPRCGARTLFAAPGRVADECGICGLDFIALERGGRFAGLVTMVLAVVLMLAALAIDEWLAPPLWVSLAVWGPVTVAAVIGTLRLYKTVLLYAAYERRGR